MRSLVVFTVLGVFLGLGFQAQVETAHRRARIEADMAFDASADGRAYIDCLIRPLMHSVGDSKPLCTDPEWNGLLEKRAQATRIHRIDVLRNFL